MYVFTFLGVFRKSGTANNFPSGWILRDCFLPHIFLTGHAFVSTALRDMRRNKPLLVRKHVSWHCCDNLSWNDCFDDT